VIRQNISILFTALIVSGCSSTPTKTNDVDVAHNACYSYIYGENGFELNYQKAFEWCSIASNLGRASAQTLLAELYLQGNGVEKNLVVAAGLYKKAALQNHVHAQLMVFLVQNIYRQEQSSQEEKAEGLIFLNQSKKAGYPKAIEVYNKIYGQKI